MKNKLTLLIYGITPFSFGVIIALDLLHLMFCMAFLIFGGYQLMKQKKALVSD